MAQTFILLVEDDKSIVSVLTFVLESLNFKVLAASSNEEAITFLRVSKPGLLLTDAYLGGESCERLIQLACEYYKDCLPIVLMSAGWFGAKQIVEKYNLCYYIEKPFVIEDLSEILSKALHEDKPRPLNLKIS